MIMMMLIMKVITFFVLFLLKSMVSGKQRHLSRTLLLSYGIVPISTAAMLLSVLYANIDYEQLGNVNVQMYHCTIDLYVR